MKRALLNSVIRNSNAVISGILKDGGLYHRKTINSQTIDAKRNVKRKASLATQTLEPPCTWRPGFVVP